nr:hypothetical protein CFP56_03069 [Quercus suber]
MSDSSFDVRLLGTWKRYDEAMNDNVSKINGFRDASVDKIHCACEQGQHQRASTTITSCSFLSQEFQVGARENA